MCFKYYVIAHNGGVKRKSGSASKPILRFYKGLRHLTSLNVTLYIDTLYFNSFLSIMPLRKSFSAVPSKFKQLMCIWLMTVPLVKPANLRLSYMGTQARSETRGWGGQNSKMKFFVPGASWGGRTWKKWTKQILAEKNFLKKGHFNKIFGILPSWRGPRPPWPPPSLRACKCNPQYNPKYF